MNPLQDLRDITEPAEITSWPPAYGWWLLAIAGLTGLIMLTWWLVKSWQKRAAKRQALLAIQNIDLDAADATSQLNQILKRAALTYFPDHPIQSMHGAKWQTFLLQTLTQKKAAIMAPTFQAMQDALYQPHFTDSADHQNFQQTCLVWMKTAIPPSQHTLKKLEQHDA